MRNRTAPRDTSRRTALALSGLLMLSSGLTGCGLGTSSNSAATPVRQSSGPIGILQGGQQPISGSTIQLWAVGTSSTGAPATPLLDTVIKSAADGSFNISGHYICPTQSTYVYLTANGGNPGLSAGTNNQSIVFMAALGQCGSLSSMQYILMNEVTTVGSAFALAPFMSSYDKVGSPDGTALSNAFITANDLVNIATGTPGGAHLPAGYGVDSSLIYTIANILAACVNSTGAGSSACTALANYTGGSTDVTKAAAHIQQNPNANTTQLFNLVPPNAPFQSKYTSAPASFNLTVAEKVAKPVINPSGGTFTGSKSVTITDITDRAAIYYTTDGTSPQSSATRSLYATAITVASTQTVQAIATKASFIDSDVAAATFTINGGNGNANGHGVLTTVAGNFSQGGSGDGGQATSAQLSSPFAVLTAPDGSIYIGDNQTATVRRVAPDGIITTVAGGGTASPGLGGQATDAQLSNPMGLALDRDGNLFIGETYRVVKVDHSGVLSAVAGDGTFGFNGANTPLGDGGAAVNGHLYEPYALAFDSTGNLYIGDFDGMRIRKVNTSGIISTLAGNGQCGTAGDGGLASNATVCAPFAIAFDSADNLYVSDQGHHSVRKITPSGTISIYAGTGTCGFSGDGAQAKSAKICAPQGLTISNDGTLYFADFYNFRIRKVTTSGVISAIAGNGQCYSLYAGACFGSAGQVPITRDTGEGLVATNAALGSVRGISVNSDNDVYYADNDAYVVRKISH